MDGDEREEVFLVIFSGIAGVVIFEKDDEV